MIAIGERWSKQRLHRGKGHGLDTVNHRVAELTQGFKDAFSLGNAAAIARDHSNQGRTVRRVKESGVCGELVRSRRHVITEVADYVNGHPPMVEEETAQDRRNRAGSELETSDSAEIPASAPERPEQIIVFISAGSEHLSIGSHHLRRQQIVDRHPVFANQPANSTSEGQATNTSPGHYAARDCEPEDMRFSIDVTQSRSALYSNSSGRSIYENGSHSGKINHQTV